MISEWDKNDKTLKSVPTMNEYSELKVMLATNIRGLVMMRMAAETGITRIELATILKVNLNIEKCELFLHRSKAVKKRKNGKIVYIERNRYVPINSSLMPLLLAYIDSHDSPHIFAQKNHYKNVRGLAPESIDAMFKSWGIPFTPHKFRHFFKSQMKFNMINEKSVDIEVIKEIMGHSLSVSEMYGDNPFEYKLKLVNQTFG
jgi:integrase